MREKKHFNFTHGALTIMNTVRYIMYRTPFIQQYNCTRRLIKSDEMVFFCAHIDLFHLIFTFLSNTFFLFC